MSFFRQYIVAAVVLSFALPAIAEEKESADEPVSKEMELKACGPSDKEVNYKAGTDKSQHPTPAQPADKALIYVLRPSMIGNKVQSKLAVDGDWKGTNRGDNYFYFTLDPGAHYFCSLAENRSVLKLDIAAGKTYYLQQHVRMGMMKARNKLAVMDEEEGKAKVANAHLSTWETK
jgi:hypothetical protein